MSNIAAKQDASGNRADIQLHLQELYHSKPWFHSTGTDQYGRPVIYVKEMAPEAINVPQLINGNQVMVDFAAYKEANPNSFIDNKGTVGHSIPLYVSLADKLALLADKCGMDTLSEIYFEFIDQETGEADTHTLSDQYPDERKGLEKLYRSYGDEALLNEFTVEEVQ